MKKEQQKKDTNTNLKEKKEEKTVLLSQYLWFNFLQMDTFVYESLQHGMYLDSLENSHPINQRVDNPNEINELFDSISYDKVNQ